MSPVQPNGTHARDIVIHFKDVTGVRVTSSFMSKSIIQAKALLDAGYTKEEVISVIDHLHKSVPDMYSVGFLSYHMEKALREIAKERAEEEVRIKQEEVKQAQQQQEQSIAEEVQVDVESAKRNREKADRLRAGIQSRVREKFNFDMFEE